MTPALGGPGLPCSITRVRRLEAGELAGAERAEVEAHLAGCARCQAAAAELASEREALAVSLPFESLAAGVAERLARPAPAPRWRRALPLALAAAAALIVAVAVPLVLSVSRDRSGNVVKGGAPLTVYVRAGDDVRALSAGEPVPQGGALRVALHPGSRRFAAVALLDADGAALLHAGAAVDGLLEGAVEWTGAGPGALVLVLDDRPVDGAALAARLEKGGVAAASPGGGAEVAVVPLARGAR